MTPDIFIDWLENVNQKIVNENRKILMILDNVPLYPKDLILFNVELFYFPPNTTSKT